MRIIYKRQISSRKLWVFEINLSFFHYIGLNTGLIQKIDKSNGWRWKNAKDEIAKVKKQVSATLVKIKNQLRLWQVMAVALFGMGLAIGWIL